MSKVIIIGGGAAGMLAAISAALIGHEVSIYEKNEKLGKKLYITGKGRCNLTNASSMDIVMTKVVSNPKFLYSAFKSYTNENIMQLIEENSCPLKIERGNRVFPLSDHSSDIIKALTNKLKELNVNISLRTEVSEIIVDDYTEVGYKNKVKGIILKNKERIYADSIILCTGGMSYAATGSTGDGYNFAKKLGHNIIKPTPSLVPLNIKEDIVRNLQGLSLKNVEISIKDKDKLIDKDFGEMIFTHFGVSGPLILSASSYIVKELENTNLDLYLDLKPALNFEKLELRLLRDFDKGKNKSIKNILTALLPSALIPIILDIVGIDSNKKVNEISKKERNILINNIKALKFTITSTRGFKEAIITKGGIDTKEVKPKTMESKLVKNLFFAGEVLDIDALTGGYNLQIAWSSAWCAGENIEYV